jgi:hypothetical protein
MLRAGENSEIDETTWQAWLEKNRAQDRIRYERRLRAMALVAVFLTVSGLLWKLII